jgi:hypothetical protein
VGLDLVEVLLAFGWVLLLSCCITLVVGWLTFAFNFRKLVLDIDD